MASSAQRIFTVPVEFLRHGPPHNQLLSRLTEYLALCGDLGAVSVWLPFDHAEYERRLSALSYLGFDHKSEEQRRGQLEELGERMRDLLGAVPGLPAGLAEANSLNVDLAHLRLVLTPNELALLPFECAFVPDGAPGGSGQRLVLQSRARVTITRQVRGVTAPPTLSWPSKPRILFAWASPPELTVPYEAHLVELRRALAPWILPFQGYAKPEDRRDFVRDQVKAHLTLLPDASVESLRMACASGGFTHVHLLAHGVPATPGVAPRIGLALRDAGDPAKTDVVDGERLAAALRFRDSARREDLGRPLVVTIASCDSGRIPSVVSHGASLAHQLHIAGVPVVVASQFPLSFAGSVIMVSELYRRMLAGEDIRAALHFARTRLFATLDDTHDWASLVAYTSLPNDFEKQLARSQFEVAKQSINRIMDEADEMIFDSDPKRGGLSGRDAHAGLERLLSRLPGLAAELAERNDDQTEVLGLQGSIEKRRAQLFYNASQAHMDHEKYAFALDSLEALRRARRHYRDALHCDLWNHWVAVQYLSLTRLLTANGELAVDPDDENWDFVWEAARRSCERDRTSANWTTRAWAHASLAELYLLRVTAPMADPTYVAHALALEHAHRLLQHVGRESFEAYSTGRQFERYATWWSNPLLPDGMSGLNTGGLAAEIAALFPPTRAFVRPQQG